MFKKISKTQLDDNLDRINFVRNRIKIVEKYFPELEKVLYDYTDKIAKSRDCIDKMAMVLNDYANAEKVTLSSKHQTNDFANILLEIGTERDAHVQAMKAKVLERLSECDKLCSFAQAELKLSLIANEKERNCLRQLNRAKENYPQDLQRISTAEGEVLKARGESVRSRKHLEEHIDIFERRRLNTLKESLLSWVLVELQFHSKALQLHTSAYQIIAEMDINSEIEEFRTKLKFTEDPHGSDSNSILQLMSSPFQKKMEYTGSGIPHLCSPQCSSFNNSFQEN